MLQQTHETQTRHMVMEKGINDDMSFHFQENQRARETLEKQLKQEQ